MSDFWSKFSSCIKLKSFLLKSIYFLPKLLLCSSCFFSGPAQSARPPAINEKCWKRAQWKAEERKRKERETYFGGKSTWLQENTTECCKCNIKLHWVLGRKLSSESLLKVSSVFLWSQTTMKISLFSIHEIKLNYPPQLWMAYTHVWDTCNTSNEATR